MLMTRGAIAGAACFALASVARADIPASAYGNALNLNDVVNYHPIGGPTAKILPRYDKAEKAMCFRVESTAAVAEFWPYFRTTEGMAGITAMEFEVKTMPASAKVDQLSIYFPPQEKVSGEFNYLASKPGVWQKVRVDFNRPGFDMAKVPSLQIKGRVSSPEAEVFFRNIKLYNAKNEERQLTIGKSNEVNAPIYFEASPLQFHQTPGKAGNIEFRTADPAGGSVVGYDILDYYGNVFAKGKSVAVKDGKFAISESLPEGFWEISFPQQQMRFGVMSYDKFTAADPFFATEALISEKAPATQRQLLDILKRYQINTTREWSYLSRFYSDQGQRYTNFDVFYSYAAEAGIKATLCLGSGFPVWMNGTNVGTRQTPQDLSTLPGCINEIISANRDGFDSFHILNEYEDHNVPAEVHLSIIKSAAYGVPDGVDMLAAPFCQGETTPLTKSLDNHLLDYIDVFAFHNYEASEGIEHLVSVYRKNLMNYPRGAMPMYITECGSPWLRWDEGKKVHTDGVYNGPAGKLRADLSEDLRSAMYITMDAVEAKACGVARVYAFTAFFFPEGDRNFGLNDYFNSPMRNFGAYVYLLKEIGNLKYRGDIANPVAGLVRARVFGDEHKTVAVLYTGKTGGVELDLSGLPLLSLRDMAGRAIALAKDGKYVVAGGLVYAALAADKLDGVVKTDTEAMRLTKISESYIKTPRLKLPVVYQFNFRECASKVDKLSYHLKDNTVMVNAYNFSDAPQTIAPKLELPEGITAPDLGQITIAPKQTVKLAWPLEFAKPKAQFELTLRDNLHPGAEFSCGILYPFGLRGKAFDISDPARWRANSSGKMTITGVPEEKAVRFAVDFDVPGRWVYPEFVLKDGESMKGVVGVAFDLKCTETMKGLPSYANTWVGNFMACYDTTPEKALADYVEYGVPSTEYKRYFVSIDAAKADSIKMIRVGKVATADHSEITVKNMEFLYSE